MLCYHLLVLDPDEINIYIHYINNEWVTYGNIKSKCQSSKLNCLNSLDENEFYNFFNKHGFVNIYKIRNYKGVLINDCIIDNDDDNDNDNDNDDDS